jgi:hypothetical protein
MRRKYWTLLAVVPGLLLAADIVYWQIASARLRDGLQSWIALRRSEGWEVDTGRVSIGGWPQAATVTVPTLTLRHAGPDIPGTVSWASAGVRVSLSLYQPSNLQIGLTGPQHVRFGGSPDMIVTGDRIGLSVGLLSDDALPLTLRARDIRLEPATGDWHVTIGLLNADAEVNRAAAQSKPAISQPAVAFSFSIEAIALPATVKWPLGPNISSLSAEGALNGPLPNIPDATAWAEAWRDGGGSLEISHLALGWGPLGATSSATLALDDQLQPMGSGSGRLVGYADTLDKLAAGGVLTRSAATAAKAVLSLIAGTGDGDTRPSVDVPLTLQYRTLSMRQIPLLRLPELDWRAR